MPHKQRLQACLAPAGKREKQEAIGHAKINVKDVVRNRRLKDAWALQVQPDKPTECPGSSS